MYRSDLLLITITLSAMYVSAASNRLNSAAEADFRRWKVESAAGKLQISKHVAELAEQAVARSAAFEEVLASRMADITSVKKHEERLRANFEMTDDARRAITDDAKMAASASAAKAELVEVHRKLSNMEADLDTLKVVNEQSNKVVMCFLIARCAIEASACELASRIAYQLGQTTFDPAFCQWADDVASGRE